MTRKKVDFVLGRVWILESFNLYDVSNKKIVLFVLNIQLKVLKKMLGGAREHLHHPQNRIRTFPPVVYTTTKYNLRCRRQNNVIFHLIRTRDQDHMSHMYIKERFVL